MHDKTQEQRSELGEHASSTSLGVHFLSSRLTSFTAPDIRGNDDK